MAREFAAAHRRMLQCFRGTYRMPPQEAVAEASALDPVTRRHALDGDPASVTWNDLDRVAEHDPEVALHRWAEIRRAAADDLASGHRAARALEGSESARPFERAEFLALRTAMAEEWRPRGGMEWLLIDKLAQASSEEWRWLQLAVDARTQQHGEASRAGRRVGSPQTPRVSFVDATEQAMAMADRWNRISCRTLRALRDLRKFDVRVNIHGPGQVNVGAAPTK